MTALRRAGRFLPLITSLWLAMTSRSASAVTAGTFVESGNTLVSAMMMFLGNEEQVYILDKAENNKAQVAGHPAWGSVWNVDTHETTVMDVRTNVFCASGMHLPNGSFVTFGGNGAVGIGGNRGSQVGMDGQGAWDATIGDFDGRKAIRVLNPCRTSDNFNAPACQWYDDPTVLAMKRNRWYSTAEPTGEGQIVIIGGFVAGGYINRNVPNVDPEFEGGAADCTYEYFPAKSTEPQAFKFLIQTSGLNAYAHTFLMPSGKMFVQANVSTVLWDHDQNIETPLPDMPGSVVRVYPASGAAALLPLTPENNYNPTVIFCGGQDMPEDHWGDYAFPTVNTWEFPASKDCQRIAPEPEGGKAVAYEQDDDMPEGRSMTQFIILPDGKLLLVNGALNGTAGYSQQTGIVKSYADMPFGESLASGPVLTPAIYDPKAAKGKRWSTEGLGSSKIARMYHSTAILLADGSVLIAGSNANVDVNLTTIYPTEYRMEIFYPPYFSKTRPVATGAPEKISYGGPSFDMTIPASSYSGSANDAAVSATVVIMRGGFSTHAMNMGQRMLQLNNTYTVNKNGSITLHVAQAPPNANLFQPGPALLFVNMHGVPSNGSYVIVGNGQIGVQPTEAASTLPATVRLDSASGSASGSGSSDGDGDSDGDEDSGMSMGLIIGIAAGGVAVLVLGAVVFVCMRRRKAAAKPPSYKMALSPSRENKTTGDASSFVPMNQQNDSRAWNAHPNESVASFSSAPYRDDPRGGDPYGSQVNLAAHGGQYGQDTPRSQNAYGGQQQYRY